MWLQLTVAPGLYIHTHECQEGKPTKTLRVLSHGRPSIISLITFIGVEGTQRNTMVVLPVFKMDKRSIFKYYVGVCASWKHTRRKNEGRRKEDTDIDRGKCESIADAGIRIAIYPPPVLIQSPFFSSHFQFSFRSSSFSSKTLWDSYSHSLVTTPGSMQSTPKYKRCC